MKFLLAIILLTIPRVALAATCAVGVDVFFHDPPVCRNEAVQGVRPRVDGSGEVENFVKNKRVCEPGVRRVECWTAQPQNQGQPLNRHPRPAPTSATPTRTPQVTPTPIIETPLPTVTP